MDASNNCGGGGAFRQWWLTATDWVGNSTRKIIYGKVMRVTQENNTDGSLSNYAVKPTITYSGAWSTSTFAGYSLGKAQKTTAAGASATMTVAVPSGAVSHMGLVMGTGPQRGSFKLYVDGVLTKTISTYAAANRDRVIVWEKSMRVGHPPSEDRQRGYGRSSRPVPGRSADELADPGPGAWQQRPACPPSPPTASRWSRHVRLSHVLVREYRVQVDAGMPGRRHIDNLDPVGPGRDGPLEHDHPGLSPMSRYALTVAFKIPSTYTLADPRVGPLAMTSPTWLTLPAGTVTVAVTDAPAGSGALRCRLGVVREVVALYLPRSARGSAARMNTWAGTQQRPSRPRHRRIACS